jgi:hypothetical protein
LQTIFATGAAAPNKHPQLSHTGHPVDGALVGTGLLWPISSLERKSWTIPCMSQYLLVSFNYLVTKKSQ